MYQQRIREIAPNYDPRHIEGYMRSERGTLDDLSPSRFRSEVQMAVLCIREGGIELAEKIARSYGL